jgi:Spy/CpxP family protein refolding chaperone
MIRTVTAIAMAAALLAGGASFAQTASDPLAQGFAAPPDSAKPRTWWQCGVRWMAK